ncbi:uncharacterized protein [Lepeophtheirus salmonis]|uniref:uncharacterized protein isoform X2 n=1 Tax=Lepeophtheirus salmonis TaxID=72036 RepID=UPI001AE3497E|nr:calpain-B-like isoform X2 [Lepeophtheirus salmonis]
MSLPYPVAPDSSDPGRPFLPNMHPEGNAHGYYNNGVGPPPSTGYPTNPSSFYPSVPSASGYPPSPSGYPPNPSGYPANPTPGPGYPPMPASSGYPNSSSAYPNIPSEAPQMVPSLYPSTDASPISNHPYPTNPGYPTSPSDSNASAPSAPPSSQYPSSANYPTSYPSGSSSQTPYPSGPTTQNPYPSGPASQNPYPSGPPGQSPYPSGPTSQNPYPSGPTSQNPYPSGPTSQNPYPSGPTRQNSYPSGPFQGSTSSAYPGAPSQELKVFKPFISSGLDNLPLNEGLSKKFQQYASDPKSNDMRDFNHQNFQEIKTKILKQRTLFEDSAFPASNSLLIDKYNGQEFVVSYFGRSKYEEKTIKWLRPHEICKASGSKKNPQMFVGATNRFDINQGELGNCWFLAALSNLVEDKRYLDQVIPPDQSFHSSYAGIFRFRFWRYGRWVEVVIDDRLPTRNGKLIFLRSIDSNEFWGALLEKAYAKLHGSYKALEGGLTIEAAVDFTGGIPELISIDQLSMSKERLFYLMSSADRNGAFMGAAVTKKSGFSQEAKSKGLHTSHAYTITNVVEIRSSSCSGGIPLIRIRNPHGNSKEWKGDWADGDKHWKAIPVHLREKLGLIFEDDGEFYMSFSDFCRFFGELEICHLTPDAAVVNFDPHATRIKRFEVFHFFGSWSNAKNTSGRLWKCRAKSILWKSTIFFGSEGS